MKNLIKAKELANLDRDKGHPVKEQPKLVKAHSDGNKGGVIGALQKKPSTSAE